MKRVLTICLAMLLALSVGAPAQSLQETMQKISADAAKAYVAPIVSGFGADLNGGWFHRAPSAKMFGFDLEFGLVAMGAKISDGNKTFEFTGNFQFAGGAPGDNSPAENVAKGIPGNAYANAASVPGQQQAIINKIASLNFPVTLHGPTVVGPKDEFLTLSFQTQNITVNGSTYAIGTSPVVLDGVGGALDNVSLLPLAAPQISIGTIFGTQATIRYLPEYELSADIGKFKYFGFGIQHNPGIWFPNPLPIDLSVAFFTQKLSVGTLFETKTTAFGVNVSKRFGPGALNITPYAGFMLESSKMSFTYNATFVDAASQQQVVTPIGFSMDGENKSRITLGLSIKLLFLNINADYNIGKYTSYTGGLMFII